MSSRSHLLKHYKLQHRRYRRSQRYPCTYLNCPCSFKTWNALLINLSQMHAKHSGPEVVQLATFSCNLCACAELSSERDYFAHVKTHLKRNETVCCMFSACDFQRNVYGTFKFHKNKKHIPHSLSYFKLGVVTITQKDQESDIDIEERQDDVSEVGDTHFDPNKSHKLIATFVENLAAMLLKLEHFVHVPATAIDEFLEELHYLLTSASSPLSENKLQEVFEKHNLAVEKSVLNDIASVSALHPLYTVIWKGGVLSTAYPRKKIYDHHFIVVVV